ncbi:AAEL009803-PA [Aedes aegypti]|uniref:AAEL009803-PA n=2 Tax=Aedes aegypti TaxID=7159 RepID=A0A1S4FND3_AEDAE|nr:cuticle protein [Aedes aegypti]EAT38300.1 AAEL009803-PA [Aedes aegypti]
MASKFVTFLALVAVAHAGVLAPVGYSAPLGYASPLASKTLVTAPLAKTVVAEQYDPNPQYSFAYGVSDGLTGDQKSQQESRSGDVVQGSYSLVDSDGLKRTVDYVADPINGFNAAVRREPLTVAAKTIVAQPAYAAPVAKTIISQPAIASYASPLAARTIVSQPALASYASPLASKTILSQPAYASSLATKTIVSQPAIASYSAPLAAKTIISQPALTSFAGPLAAKTIVSQPALASYAAPAYYN